MTYEDLVPPAIDRTTEKYVPRVFGFRIHSSSGSLPRIGTQYPFICFSILIFCGSANTVSSSQSSSGSTNGHPTTSMIVGNDYHNEDAQLFPGNHPAAAAAKRKLASFNNSDRHHIVGANSTGDSYTSSAPVAPPTAMTASAPVPVAVAVIPSTAATPTATARIASPSSGMLTRAFTSMAQNKHASPEAGAGGSAGKKSRIE